MKILIVDDSKAMRMIVMRTLRQAGYDNHTLVEAGNGEEALKVLRAGGIDVVLSDWNMPQMNGIQLLQALTAEGIKVKFGFVTSEGTEEIRQKAAENGALFVVTKPFTADAFRNALGAL